MGRGVLVLACLLAVASGCRTTNQAALVPVEDEFTIPPDDPRFTNPPTAGYKKPAPKKAWGATPGNMSNPLNTGGAAPGQMGFN
jgi:hypothetical protein